MSVVFAHIGRSRLVVLANLAEHLGFLLNAALWTVHMIVFFDYFIDLHSSSLRLRLFILVLQLLCCLNLRLILDCFNKPTLPLKPADGEQLLCLLEPVLVPLE